MGSLKCTEMRQIGENVTTEVQKKSFFALFPQIQDGRPDFFWDVHHRVTQLVILMYNTWGLSLQTKVAPPYLSSIPVWVPYLAFWS